MAKLALHKFGSQANLDDLTAIPEDVLEGNIFLGKGSEEKQTGTLPDKKSPTIILPVNGEINLGKLLRILKHLMHRQSVLEQNKLRSRLLGNMATGISPLNRLKI